MTYAKSGLIQAIDYNGFVSTNSPNVNAIWSVGSGNSGYGQPTLPTVTPDSTIFASSAANLITAIKTSASHQGTTIGSFLDDTPTSGELIQFESNMSSNINLINTNRLNAVAQASTSNTVATSTTSWSNSLTITFTVTFADADKARYYFNAGGQIGFNFSHPAGTGANSTMNSLCSAAGTVWISSPTSGTALLSGLSYSGITKIGGSNPAGTVVNTNYGFHAFTSTSTQLINQTTTGGGYYYTGAFLRISGSKNTSGVVTFVCLFDDIGGGGYYYGSVSAGTQATLVLRPPSTTYLTNSWGTPTVASTIIAS